MNIYHVERTDEIGWDEYYAFVCVAPDEETARRIYPEHNSFDEIRLITEDYKYSHCWVPYNCLQTLRVEKIGCADSYKMKIVCSSYHNG